MNCPTCGRFSRFISESRGYDGSWDQTYITIECAKHGRAIIGVV